MKYLGDGWPSGDDTPLPMTLRDRMKAQSMLRSEEMNQLDNILGEKGWGSCLRYMLMLNIKREIEVVEELPGGLVGWLESQLQETLAI